MTETGMESYQYFSRCVQVGLSPVFCVQATHSMFMKQSEKYANYEPSNGVYIHLPLTFLLPRDASAECGYEIACRLSVTIRYRDHIGWNFWKIISRPNNLRSTRSLTPTWAIWCNGNTPKIRVE